MDKKNVIGDSRIGSEQRKKYLENRLRRYVYDQKELEVEEVKNIVQRLNEMEPEEPLDKAAMWERIQEASKEEMPMETGVTEKLVAEAADVFIPENGKTEPAKKEHAGGTKRRRRFTRPVIVAAALVAAVFVGANIGTYATEKMNVFQYVGEMRNGTAFRVSGDAPMMGKDKEIDTYYSWNEVPNEYREYLIIPQGIPKDMELYSIRVHNEGTYEWLQVCYLNDKGEQNINIDVRINQNQEFTFGNLSSEQGYKLLSKEMVDDWLINYYSGVQENTFAEFVNETCYYIIYGNLEEELIHSIVEQTIEYNF